MRGEILKSDDSCISDPEIPRISDWTEAPVSGADGVVGSTTAYFIDRTHPVCAINVGFAAG